MRVVEFRRLEVKRDMDLIREILLKIEDDPTLNGSTFKAFEASDFEGRSQEEITYHVDLLFEADFIFGMPHANPLPAISRLKWKGHEFIGTIKDPEVWQSVKARLKGLPDVAISVIWEIAKAEFKKKAGLS